VIQLSDTFENIRILTHHIVVKTLVLAFEFELIVSNSLHIFTNPIFVEILHDNRGLCSNSTTWNTNLYPLPCSTVSMQNLPLSSILVPPNALILTDDSFSSRYLTIRHKFGKPITLTVAPVSIWHSIGTFLPFTSKCNVL
jgi:hypothetical protein